VSTIPPLFVIGCPRSGTTLVGSLLRETAWGPPVESHFITKYARLLPRYGDLTRREARVRLLRDLLKERPVLQWKLELDPDAFVEPPETADYAELVNRVCLARVTRRGRSGWADKTPHYVLEMDIVDRLFPDALYLQVLRDGRDVALSLLGRKWGPRNVYACAQLWRRCTEENVVLDRLRAAGRLLDVRYETLLGDPLRQAEGIHRFLGQPFDPSRLEAVLNRVAADNSSKWRTRLRPAQVRTFEAVAGRCLARLGYEVVHSDAAVDPVRRLAWTAHDAVGQFAHRVRLNTIDSFRIRFLGMEPFAEPDHRPRPGGAPRGTP
jgi:hypothetical protein